MLVHRLVTIHIHNRLTTHTHTLSPTCTHTLSYMHTHTTHYLSLQLVHSQKKHKITSTIQMSRHVALDNECRSRNSSLAWRSLPEAARLAVAQRIVVNDQHELLYCAVPLLSMGPWMKVLYYISPNRAEGLSDVGQVPGEELGTRKNFVYLSSFSLDEQERRLNTYLSFMVSRHPFQRLAIAYKLKLENSNAFFHDRYGKAIVKNYRKGGGGKNPTGNDVKFSEFAQYISEVSVDDMNEHWQPLETLCQPCVVDYDVILHHESMEREAEELLGVAQLSSHVTKFPYNKWDSLEASYVHTLYRELSPSLVGRLVQLYRSDFGLFSYSSLL